MTLPSGISLSGAVDHVLNLHGVAAYAIVGFLAFAEAAFFVGFVLPGETAVVLGGVLASRHAVSLPVMIVVVVLSAIAGDTVGYEVGRHFGERVLAWRVFDARRAALNSARDFLRRKGGRAVFLGRFTAFLRAVMPGLAGTAQMPYRRFILANAGGAVIWGTGFVLLGYFAGASYDRITKVAGRASIALLVAVVVIAVLLHLRRRRAERRAEESA